MNLTIGQSKLFENHATAETFALHKWTCKSCNLNWWSTEDARYCPRCEWPIVVMGGIVSQDELTPILEGRK